MGLCQSQEDSTSSNQSLVGSRDTLPQRHDLNQYDAQGRRLHVDVTPLSEDALGKKKLYVLPNDDEEMDRLHLQHYLVRMMFGSNFSAPVEGRLERFGSVVLDVGCGSGIWAFETATEFPQAIVTGLDMSPVQPSTVKPQNVDFVVGDITQLPLPYDNDTFDFVHMRFLISAVRKDFWPILIAELVRIVKPGGWLELMEFANVPYEGFMKGPNLLYTIISGLITRGCDMDIARKLKPYLSAHPHLTNVTEVTKELQMGPPPSDKDAVRLAKLYADDVRGFLGGLKAQLVAKGVCEDRHYARVAEMHIREMQELGHVVTWTRCFAQKVGVGYVKEM
ncbi:hypothetical protein HDV00_007435 [Rhizophlyctis rosea]|nr:hypothetical protein HDV00_007435 [Rhizophlyctis rosea]